MKFKIKAELKSLWEIILSLDKKVITIFISVAALQTISWYYTSRGFFRRNLYFTVFENNPNVQLYEYLYWFFSELVTSVLLPILIIKLFLKEKISDFGFKLGDYKTGLKISAIFLLIMLPLLWFASSQPDFAAKYPHLPAARERWLIFLIYEFGMLAYMFSWEFIWRGYMLFGLEKKFGYYAVLIQMIPFVILHNGKPELETFSAILGGIALGILALRTRSFLYCVIVHFGIMLGIDFISVLRFKSDVYGLGLDSLFNLISNLF
jgi:membrane protease YdiL (CAAX protease family)